MKKTRKQKEITNHYNKIGKYGIYDFLVSFFLLGMDRNIRNRLIKNGSLKEEMDVLDVGTGTGRNIPLIRDVVGPSGSVTGVDISSGMLQRARRFERYDNVDVKESDIYEYNPSFCYDAIVASYVLCVIPEPEKLLKQINKLLKPNGKILFLTASFPNARGMVFRKVLEFEEWIAAANLSIDPSHIFESRDFKVEHSFEFWRYINGFSVKRASGANK